MATRVSTIGGTTQAYAFLDSILSSMGPSYIPGLVETHFKKHVALERIRATGRVKDYEEGGHGLVLNLAIGENGTIMFRGPKQDPDVQFGDWVTTAYFGWGTMTGSLVFWDIDINRCRGKAQLLQLVEPQIKQAVNTIAKRLSWAVCQGSSNRSDDATQVAPGAEANDMLLGFRDGIAGITGTYPNTYGQLAPQTDTVLGFWYANVLDGATGGMPKLIKNMEHVANSCVHGEYPLDFVLSDQAGAEAFADTLRPNIRYSFAGDAQKGEATFRGYDFNGLPVLWDVDCKPMVAGEVPSTGWTGGGDTASTSRFEFVSPQSFAWYWNPVWNERNAISPEWRYPEVGFRRSKQIAIQCQLVCEDRRSNGVLYNVPTA